MPGKIRCGVIGAGWWATYAHIPALLSCEDAELVAIQNDNAEEVEKIARDFQIAKAFVTVADLLAVEGLSAVVISSSPGLHYANASAALAAGKHVLIEKPMTLTAREAMQLVKMAEERDLQFLISAPWHYTAHAVEARRMIREGAIGDVRMISVLMTNPIQDLLRGANSEPTHGTPYMHPRLGTYSDPQVAGGGQIYAQVCHAAAYLTFLTGARATEVFARFHNDGAALDIYDSLSLRLNDGSVVSIASTGATTAEAKSFEVRIFGTKGILSLELWQGTMQFAQMHGASEKFPDLMPEEVYPHQMPALNLIESVRDKSLNRSPAILGVAAMEVIEAACRSAESGANIQVASLTEPLI